MNGWAIGWLIGLAIAGFIAGLMALVIVVGSQSGPGIVYDPQVVDRPLVDSGGTTVAHCAVSHSGMACWPKP